MKKLLLILGLLAIATACKSAELKFASPTLVTNAITNLSVTRTNSTNFLGTFVLFKTNIITATATLDFPDTSAGAVSTLSVTLTGARIGDAVFLGIDPDIFVSTAPFTFIGWVSASDEVSIRFVNNHTGNINPNSNTFRVVVYKP
jgi:hypothetical protein